MADNLTLKLKEELEKRHGKAVSEADVAAFLQAQGFVGGVPSAVQQVQQPTQQPTQSLYPWEDPEPTEAPPALEAGSALNAVGVGLWSALDTALFGVPGRFVEEEKFLDFEDPLGKYAGAVGGLAGFIAGGPMKLGAKAVQRVAAPFIKKDGFRTVAEASKGMLKRASEHGVDKKVAKDITGHYRKLAQKAQIDPDTARNFGKKATDLLVNYTDDAVRTGRITQAESVAIKKMFGENFTKRPLQDFVGLMHSRGLFKSNPRMARVASHAVNEALMFGMIDTAFEGVRIFDPTDPDTYFGMSNFDWTAPMWGASTGLVFSQLQWMNPVGKGAAWGRDFRTGVKAAFGKKAPYKEWGDDQLKATSKFFGEQLERTLEGSHVVSINHAGKTASVGLLSENVLKQLNQKFGMKEGRNALIGFLEKERNAWGKELIKASTGEGINSLGKNWFRMLAGGAAFNFHTFADMFLHGTEVGIHDVLPHFLIGAYLQIGRNPASFDLNSTKMNRLRSNLLGLGVKVETLPSEIPSFKNTPSRFANGVNSQVHKETLSSFERGGLGSKVIEATEGKLQEGEISAKVQGNTKYERIRDEMSSHFEYLKPLDETSTREAREIVETFERETGLKSLKEYDRHFDEASVQSTKKLEGEFPNILEKVKIGDELGELEIIRDAENRYQSPETVIASEELLRRARDGELDWIRDANGEKITDGKLAEKMLMDKLDGYGMIVVASTAMGKAKAMPAGKETMEVKNEGTIKNIFEAVTNAEQRINEGFPSKMSYSDSFTFAGSAPDYFAILGRNMAIESSSMMSHIFSKNFEQRDALISFMRGSGLLVGEGVTNPLLRADISKVELRFPEGTSEATIAERTPELKRILRRVQMLQSISGGYEKSQDIDRVEISVEKIDKLSNFLRDSGMKDMHRMPEWIFQDTMNYIIRDKIKNAPNLQLEEMNAFMRIADMEMSNFNMDLRKGQQGFEISMIDEAFVPPGSKSQAIEYNNFALTIIQKSNGLIKSAGKKKVVNSNDITALVNSLPKYEGEVAQAPAREALLEFIDNLPRGEKITHAVGQYVMEGGSPDVVNWLSKNGVLEYNKKSSTGWNINMEKFNKELASRLLNRVEKQGFTPEYVQETIAREEQAARAAMDEASLPEIDHRFDGNKFLQKYQIDYTDYSVESKELKRKVIDELILSKHAPLEDRVPAADVIKNVLDRIHVKNDKGEWITFQNVPEAEQPYVKKQISRDVVKLIASQYNSVKVNTLKLENGNVTEREAFQQDTRLRRLIEDELNLPLTIIEKEAIVYEQFQGRIQRRFIDMFGNSSDLPEWERSRIQPLREEIGRLLNVKSRSFGSEHPDGMVIFQISKDTAPIAIPRQSLENMHGSYAKFAEWALKNRNLNDGIKRRIEEIAKKIEDPEAFGKPTDFDHQVMLSQLVFNDMLRGQKKTKKIEDFLNDVDIEKTMGRIKLYDSKNFIKADRNLVQSMSTIYRDAIKDNATYEALNKIMRQDGFGVAIWNDADYANVRTEVEKVLKDRGFSEKQRAEFFDGVLGDAHEKVSSFDSIGFVSRSQMRYLHAMMGHNPESTNPIKPTIASGGRSGQLLMGKTLFIYDKSLDSFFETNRGVDILLASTGAKAYNEGAKRDGLDVSVINQPYNRINSMRPLGQQKIRKIPIDALGFKPEVDLAVKDAKESTSDFNYMRQAELDLMFKQNYESDIRQAVQSMKDLNLDPIRIRRFVLDIMGNEGVGIDPASGGAQHMNNIVRYAAMHTDANPMSYSDQIVKNKMYNVFINNILNGKRSSIKTEQGIDARYGGQAPIIQVADAKHRLNPTIVGTDGKMKLRGEIMIGEHERSSSLSDIAKSGRDMVLVDGAKVIDPKEFFGSYQTKREGKKYIWDDMMNEGFSLGELYDIIETGKTGIKPYSKDLQIGILTNRKPHTRPNDMAVLGLKGFLAKEYGRAALVNSLDVVNIFEGDYDADKVDYFYGARKSMYNYAERAAGLYVQGVDPTSLKKPSTFSWADPAETIVRNIQDMAASADVSKKTIGVAQKVPRMLNNLDAIAMSGKGDVALDMRFGAEKRRPKILFFTPGPQGEKYRITVDFDNLDFYTRAALETQYILDMGGGVNTELMRDVRNWKDRYLFPEIEESITPNKIQRDGPGFINENIRNKSVSKRVRIFRKFAEDGSEQVLTSLEKDMIKTMMREYSKLLNVAGGKTFTESSEQRATKYDDVYEAADGYFNFHRDLSKNLYYKLRWKKDKSGNPYWKDSQFKSMWQPKSIKYGKPDKITKRRKKDFIPELNIFDGPGEQIKQNSQSIYAGEKGNVLERSLRPVWEADVFGNRKDTGFENKPSITGEMVGYMDSWYQQLRTGNLSEYTGSIENMQSNIMKTVSDYNSGAYYISSMKKSIMQTQNRNDISYQVKKKIIEKINKTIKDVEQKLIKGGAGIIPDRYWETRKGKDLKRFTFTPVEGREAKEGVIQFDTIESIKEHLHSPLGRDGREYLKYIKDVRKMFYGNSTSLGDILQYGDKSVLNKRQLDFLRDMPTISTFEQVQFELLSKGLADYGTPFILEFMSSARNNYNIGIHRGRLVPMPYGKSTRYKKGLQFLTKIINEREADDSRIKFQSSEKDIATQLLRILQTTESNFQRFYDKKFDMRNLGDPNYTVNIGTKENPIRFGLENIRLPSFGKELEKVVGDFNSIRWTRDTNRISSGFELMNDNLLSFYTDIMKLSGKEAEFKDYLNTMHGLKADMISNRVIDPIKYLATRSTIEKDVKRLVNEVLTGGKMENKDDANVKRILNNPVYIINGGHVGSGFFKGISLEQKPAYTLKKLKEVVQVKNELKESQEKLGWKTERSERQIDDFIKRCE